ncbi:type II CAAX endopeptidase family protein [Verrucomicrobiaceae bacterium 227]
MSVDEYKLLGNVLLVTVLAFFGLALPGYALVRHFWPESGWNLGGSVGTSVLQPLDLVVAGGFVSLWVLQWRQMPAQLANSDLDALTTGTILAGSLAFVMLAAVIPLVLFWRANLCEFFGLRWDGWKKIFWIMPAFVVSMFALNVVIMLSGWPEWVEGNFFGEGQKTVKLLRETKDVGVILAMVFSAVIIAPVVEEVIFRGYIYPVVKRYSERSFAALFTGVLFGVIHFNLLSLPTLAVMGVVLVVLYEVTGSLWVSIACHAAFNGTTVGLMLWAKYSGVPLPQ